jgi:hypothetical protein
LEHFDKSQTIVSGKREDKARVVTDANTVLEIAKVFDELNPSSGGMLSTQELENHGNSQ